MFEDYDALLDVLAAFYEALRVYPAAYIMFREATKDTYFTIPRQDNPPVVEKVFIKNGTSVTMDLISMSKPA